MKSTEGLQEQLEQQRQKVDVEVFDVTVRELTRMAAEGELVRAPAYQRKFRWAPEDESRLVESVFLGLPIPSIFVAANKDGKWELVDGLQRISTLMHFVAGGHVSDSDPEAKKKLRASVLLEVMKESPLTLKKLRKLSKLDGFAFDDLPRPVQLAFLKRGLKVTALSDKSDYSVRFDVFERLNRGGVALTEQEVRSCIYRGGFADLLRELSDEPRFVEMVKLQEAHQNDGTREELVLKFFAYRDRRESFKGNVRGFLNDYMEFATKSCDLTTARRDFLAVVESLWGLFHGPIVRKGWSLTPLNQLEAILVACSDVQAAKRSIEVASPDWLNDRELVMSSTGATNTYRMLETRINRAIALLSGSPPDVTESSGSRGGLDDSLRVRHESSQRPSRERAERAGFISFRGLWTTFRPPDGNRST